MTASHKPRRTFAAPSARTGAFTLMELLVAAAILALLIGFLMMFTNNTVATISNSRKSMDANSQARLVYDRMSVDFSKMLRRPDIDYTFTKRSGNDEFAFYSEVPGLLPSNTPAGQVPRVNSLLGYRVQENAQGRPMLERGARGLGWDEMVFTPLVGDKQVPKLTTPNSLPQIDPPGASPSNYQVLAEQAIRLEFCFLLRGESGNAPKLTATVPDSLDKVAAIVVGIVVLDGKSQAIVTDLDNLAGAFPDAQEGKDLAAIWQPIVNQPNFAASAGIPITAAQAVRVYQRYYPLK